MKADVFSRLLGFLERLDEARIPYQMRHSRDDAIMVVAFAPGQYWEIDFTQDGEIEIERFRSDGRIEDESVLRELFALWAEDTAPATEGVAPDGAAKGN